ncbi:AP-5 complex subunit sigma-1 [Pristimantis euphronides]
MLYGFLIHTVAPAEPSRVLHRRLFCGGTEGEPVRRQMAAVASQVASQCLLRRQLCTRPAADTEEPLTLHEEDIGVLGLPPGALFPQGALVLWVGVHTLGFSLICDPQENLPLAETTLRTLVTHLLQTLRLPAHSSNAVLRADKVELTLDTFIPQGALLFLSHPAVQALEGELSGCMTL